MNFKPIQHIRGSSYCFGRLFIEFSAPKLLYDYNITGISKEDKYILFCKIINHFADVDINLCEPVENIDLSIFSITKIERSVSFEVQDKEVGKELFNLFTRMYFSNHEPGKMRKTPYKYETSFCHYSASEDIVLYDKTAEMLEKSKILIKPNIWRLELRWKDMSKSLEEDIGRDNFGTLEDLTNNPFVKRLKRHNLHLSFMPKDQYYKLIKSYLNKKEYSDTVYKNIMNFFAYINEVGAFEAKKTSSKNYNRCLEITNNIGISILYTKLNRPVSFFENICFLKDLKHILYEDVVLKDVKIKKKSFRNKSLVCNSLKHPTERYIFLIWLKPLHYKRE
ncbi:MAG: hypothetical protein IJE14_10070 [Clostridia bacterium]|nr:hypothetical protein [Clostridia bacterium]